MKIRGVPLNKNKLERYYHVEMLSMREIADIEKTSLKTIVNELKRHGIKTRSWGEAMIIRHTKFDHPLKGKHRSDEFKRKIRAKNSLNCIGAKNANWKGGSSFKPYCIKFNDKLKEEIRNRENRVCQLCDKSEILNGRKLDVHHIDGDKMQGCNGKKWYLVALCRKCNVSKDTILKEFLIVSNNYRVIKK